jgi:hypothetical protein
MSTKRLSKGIETFSFSVSYESLCGMLINLDLYIFGEAGELIAHQPLWKGKAVITLSDEELGGARIMVGFPADESVCGPITMDVIRRHQGFEVGFSLAPGRHSVTLTPVPETVWRQWQRSGLWSRDRQKPKPSFLFW